MGRPQLDVGTYGKITAKEQQDGRWRARCKYRDRDGIVRPVERYGHTKAASEAALKRALRDRQRISGSDAITSDMRVRDLADAWLERVNAGDLAIGTKQHYAKITEAYVKPRLGSFRVGEATVATCDLALQITAERHGHAVAKSTRAVLSGLLGLAVRQGALPANPVRDTEPLRAAKRKQPRALTADEENDLCDRLRSDERAVELDLPDLVDWMLATGCRIGEALACRDAALDHKVGTWEIDATVIRVKGVGLIIQERPKTAAGWRVLALPPFALEMVERRRTELRLRGPAGVVFGSPSAKTLRDPSNCAGDLREVLDRIGCPACAGRGWHAALKTAKQNQRAPAPRDKPNAEGGVDRWNELCDETPPWAWITSHVFRKTVATKLEAAGQTPRQVADHLGHSKPSMTMDLYFGRKVANAEAARLLDRRTQPDNMVVE